jgi:glycosyl transferase family 2
MPRMIAFGCAIREPELYRRHAQPGIARAAEPDSLLIPQAAPRAPAASLNLILELAAAHHDLEALVLVDQETEILDPELARKLRDAFADPEVAVVGCAGAVGVRSIAWWEGDRAWVSSVHRSRELDGLELPALLADDWKRPEIPSGASGQEVDAVDGALMCLSPWAVRTIRFDETLGPRYGYDVDYCLQVRAAARKVLVADLRAAHYRPLGVIPDPDTWAEAHMRAAEKWDPRDSDWKAHARRAEGEAAAARLLSATKMYEAQAAAWQHERELDALTRRLSWRLTAPLRHAGQLARRVRRRSSGARRSGSG